MADRPARIRLMLESGSFLGGLQQVTERVKSASSQMGSALSRVGSKIGSGFNAWAEAGVSRMGSTIGGLADKAKSAAKWGIALGGSFSLAEAAKDAMSMESAYKNLAFAMEASTGKAVRWQEVASSAKDAADKWANSDENVVAALKLIHDETGDANFASGAINAVTKASLASQGAGKDMGTLAMIAARVREQFGLMPNQMDDALASVIGLGAKGGVPLDDLAAKLGVVGAAAKAMGHKGKEGLEFALGMLSVAKESAGGMRKATAAATSFMDELGNAQQLKEIEKKIRVKLTTPKGEIRQDAIERILVKTQGKPELLAKVFTGESWKLVTALGKPYAEVFAAARGTKTERQQAALEAFHRAVREAAKQTLTAAEIEKKATARLESPKAQMIKALNELEDVFSKPEMMSALKTMARIAPKLADGLAKLLDFTLRDPWAAAAMIIPGLLLKDFAAAGIGVAVKSALLGILGKEAAASTAASAATTAGATGGAAATGSAAAAGGGVAAGIAAGASMALVAAAPFALKGDEGLSPAERRKRAAALEAKHPRSKYAEDMARAREAIEKARKEQRGPEIERVTGPREFPILSPKSARSLAGTDGSAQDRASRRATGEDVDARRDSARASKEFARDVRATGRELRQLVPPTPGNNGLPPAGPNTPGYAPR